MTVEAVKLPCEFLNFNFFTSKDNHQIRWGSTASSQVTPFKTDAIANTDAVANTNSVANTDAVANTNSVANTNAIANTNSVSNKMDTKSSKGILLLLNGRTEFMEKYKAVISELFYMGYHVMSLDWRGQGLSIRELPNRDKGYVKNFQFYLNDLELFYNLYVVPYALLLKLPVTILAHSMGGHIALRFMAEYPNNIEKAILISPMVDIITSPIPRTFASTLTNFAIKAGLGSTYAPGRKDYSKEKAKFKNNPLTHDIENFWLEHKEIEKNRELALGGVTWGWLKAAFDSIDILKNKKYLSFIKTPIWVFSAGQDRVVCNKAQQMVTKILPKCKFISISGARHEILFERDDIKNFLWSHIKQIMIN